MGCRGLPLLVVGGETPALAKNKLCLRQPENDVSTFSGCLYNKPRCSPTHSKKETHHERTRRPSPSPARLRSLYRRPICALSKNAHRRATACRAALSPRSQNPHRPRTRVTASACRRQNGCRYGFTARSRCRHRVSRNFQLSAQLARNRCRAMRQNRGNAGARHRRSAKAHPFCQSGRAGYARRARRPSRNHAQNAAGDGVGYSRGAD